MLAQKKTVGYECQRYKASSTNPRAALKLGEIQFIQENHSLSQSWSSLFRRHF